MGTMSLEYGRAWRANRLLRLKTHQERTALASYREPQFNGYKPPKARKTKLKGDVFRMACFSGDPYLNLGVR